MSVDLSNSHEAMDVKEHERTYNGFIALTKYGTIACIIIVALMAYFLT